MIDELSPTLASYSGYFNNEINKNSEIGKIPSWKEREKIKRVFEREGQRIQSVYNCEGRLVENNDSGRHLDFFI
jgi:YD repeat-containing protein